MREEKLDLDRALWQLDCATHEVVWSSEMFKVHGQIEGQYTPSLAEMRRLYPELAKVMFTWALQPELPSPAHFSLRSEILKADGSRAMVLMTAVPRVDGAFLVGVSGAVYDLEAIEKSRTFAHETDAKYHKLFKYAPIALIQASADRRIVLANPAFCRLLGYSSEELLQLTTQDITHPEDRPSTLIVNERLIRGEADSLTYDKRYLHKDGKPVWVSLSVSLVHDLQGQPLSFIGQCIDISSRKDREIANKASLALETQKRIHFEMENKELRAITLTDELTGLLNRRFFEQHRKHQEDVASGEESYAILTVDIRSLELRNRQSGAHAVDQLLKAVGNAMLSCGKKYEKTCRVSGGMFRVLIYPCNEAMLLAEMRTVDEEIDGLKSSYGLVLPVITGELYRGTEFRKTLGLADQTSKNSRAKSFTRRLPVVQAPSLVNKREHETSHRELREA